MDCSKPPAVAQTDWLQPRKHMDCQVVKFVLRRKGAVIEMWGLEPIKIKVVCTKSKVLDNSVGYERIESFIAGGNCPIE
ncbi:MAG: hypothetical protein IPL73_19875 [Candidatus Obscuribacter sp.]|nr:hypothetical protein [Candidatus Obscuribacter sp.]